MPVEIIQPYVSYFLASGGTCTKKGIPLLQMFFQNFYCVRVCAIVVNVVYVERTLVAGQSNTYHVRGLDWDLCPAVGRKPRVDERQSSWGGILFIMFETCGVYSGPDASGPG